MAQGLAYKFIIRYSFLWLILVPFFASGQMRVCEPSLECPDNSVVFVISSDTTLVFDCSDSFRFDTSSDCMIVIYDKDNRTSDIHMFHQSKLYGIDQFVRRVQILSPRR